VIVSRARLARELAAKDEMIAEIRAQRDDWKGKAERLTDAALVRAGAVHQPTMETPKPRDRVRDAAAMITGALAVTEIESRPRAS
jgi:hypothetical protein